jgi:hypothetical protein
MDDRERKDSVISKIYYDYANMGAMQDTYNQARKKDATIKMEDVKSWYDRNLVRKNNLPGYNSVYTR